MKKITLLSTLFLSSLISTAQLLTFDGNNDYVEVPNDLNTIGTGDFTIEAWVRGLESEQQAHPVILSNSPSFPNGCVMFFHNLWGSSNYKMLCIQFGGQNHLLVNNGTFNGSILDGECHHVAITRQSGLLSFYVDGSLIGTYNSTVNQSLSSSRNVTWIGHDFGSSVNDPLKGSISEVRIWDRARTASEILNGMNSGFSASTPNLLAYWELNEGTGQLVTNKVNGNTGNLGSSTNSDVNDPTWGAATCGNIVGVEEQEFNSKVTVYPNPNSGQFQISIENNTKDVLIEVYDVVGNIIERRITNGNQTTLDISNQAKGIYFVKVKQNDIVIVEKMIVQ
jgi:concanavalin A-like lectin/glucanase superfamily protein/type IX secretion system substrate protein